MTRWIEQLQSANWGGWSGVLLGAYALGCATAAYYLVRACAGQDIRQLGSGNVGARNAGRVLGWWGFAAALTADSLKGALAVWGAREWTRDEHMVLAALLAVVAGHLWPVQLRLRGGKGVATSLGSLVALNPLLAVAFLILFGLWMAMLRKVVLSALCAFTILPLASLFWSRDPATALALSVLAGMVLFAHRRNLVEELAALGARPKVGSKHHPRDL